MHFAEEEPNEKFPASPKEVVADCFGEKSRIRKKPKKES